MKTFSALAVSLALVAIGAQPASAADMNGRNGHGSIKDGPAGTPVPAPVPYEEHYKYYMGAGLGWSFRQSGDIGLGAGGVNGSLPFGDQDEFKNPYGVSLFAGRYITPSIRAELGLDFRNKQKRSHTQAYEATLKTMQQNAGAPAPVEITNTYSMERTDDLTQRNHNAMFNVYYDMNRGGRFNPYVGAGVGLSYMHMARGSSERIVSCEGTVDPANPPPPNTPAPCQSGNVPGQPVLPIGPAGPATANGGQSGWGLAVALMAGATYNLSERTHLDMGYRFIYQGAKAVVSNPSLGSCANGCPFSGTSIMNVGARVDHELRAGIRWDLW